MPDSKEPQNKPTTELLQRQILLIKRALQTECVLFILVMAILTLIGAGLDFYGLMNKFFASELQTILGHPSFKNAAALLLAHALIYLLVVGIVAVFISHKFAGPLFRFEKMSESVAQGDLTTQIGLRQGDQLFETAEQLNAMIKSLREKVERDRNLSQRVADKLDAVIAQLERENSAPQAAAALHDLVVEIKHISADFKL